MYSMIVTECFHNKCFKLSTLRSVYIPWGCEADMILSVMTKLWQCFDYPRCPFFTVGVTDNVVVLNTCIVLHDITFQS